MSVTTTSCPSWCEADHSQDPTWIAQIHYRRVGELGLEMWAEQNPDGSLGPVHVTVGDLVDMEDLTVAQARQLGADLIAGARFLDGARETATVGEPTDVWKHGYRTGRDHALKGWPSLLDDDWETGEPRNQLIEVTA